MVQSQIINANGEPVKVDYMMRRSGDNWLISDIYLDGAISEVATRRSEFAAILKIDGIDGLIAALNRRPTSSRERWQGLPRTYADWSTGTHSTQANPEEENAMAESRPPLPKRKGLPQRPRDRRFHVKGNQGTAILANSGLDTAPDNKPRARSASIS
jgi:hypothetical protein